MPHVIVKMFSGKTDEQKKILTEQITKSIMDTLGNEANSVSVDLIDVEKKDWEKVYRQDIEPKLDVLHKKPGYKI